MSEVESVESVERNIPTQSAHSKIRRTEEGSEAGRGEADPKETGRDGEAGNISNSAGKDEEYRGRNINIFA